MELALTDYAFKVTPVSWWVFEFWEEHSEIIFVLK